MLRGEWAAMIAREGVAPVRAAATLEGDELPCPACGTAAPLVDGACADCGLQLDDGPPSGGSCGTGGCR